MSSLVVGLLLASSAIAFPAPARNVRIIKNGTKHGTKKTQPSIINFRRLGKPSVQSNTLFALQSDEEQDRTIKASALQNETPMILNNHDDTKNDDSKSDDDDNKNGAAVVGTINERLQRELQEAAEKEKYGTKSGVGKKLRFSERRDKRTPEEQEAALAAARDLNGVNPVVALTGGIFAFAVAAGLWYATNQLGAFFALHPLETDVYFVQRLAAVFRNVVMGLASLASGFFGVTGMGIFLLGIRVSYGVTTGELDPTPIKKKKSDQLAMPNVWDLMMNKKPSRRGGRGNGGDDNMFGI